MPDALNAFLEAACVPIDRDHGVGTLEAANAVLASHPELAAGSIHAAAVLGDELQTRRHLADDGARIATLAGQRQWDALTCLCFSRYLRLDATRSEGFVGAATALLAAGARAETGWFDESHQPEPAWESALYGAAGVAKHAGVTRVLLEYGADPNVDEVVYHTAEGYDLAPMRLLIGTGRLTAESLATLLIRKHDWHDGAGVQLLLEGGADPDFPTRFGRTPFQHAVLRDNALRILEMSLDHGADPAAGSPGGTGFALAARRGRGDLLAVLERRGMVAVLAGPDRLLAACALDQPGLIRSLSDAHPGYAEAVLAQGAARLAEFAGVGNTDGVRHLLDLGVDVDALYGGDGYWDVAPGSTALHVAAWRASHTTVRLLLERGARVDVRDGRGRSPLTLAVRACVDSHWTDQRSPESVGALLAAGATAEGIVVPTGYAAIDELLEVGA